MFNKKEIIIKVVIPIIVALISFTFIANVTSSTKYHKDNIEYLDEKKENVTKLVLASTTASAAITLIPGDTGTPIAESLADLSNKFIIVIGAIYLEKYLLTITGIVAFKVMIPIACLLFISNHFKKNITVSNAAVKIVLVALVMYLIVPTSIKVSNMIENTYNESIQETLDTANSAIKEVEDADKDKNLWDKIVDGVSSAVSGVTDKFTNVLNNLIEAFAVMVVTSCVIPILVILFFIWGIKIIIGIDVDTSKLKKIEPSRHINNSIKRHRKTPVIKNKIDV